MDLARSEKRLIGLNMEICINLAKEYNKKSFVIWQMVKVYQKGILGKKLYNAAYANSAGMEG